MYSVVGCSECGALKLVADRPETTECNRCGKRLRFDRLKKFVQTDDVDHAREVRASMLANRQGHGEAFAELGSFAEMESATETPAVTDEEYLSGSGVDVEAVADAERRASSSPSSGASRKDVLLAALADLDRPTEAAVVEYATERGVPRDYVVDALTKLVHRGVVSETGGRYRLL